ncbi:hypothetical protein H4R33_005642 [Dimargaris cristalligena]|nr:hypothetical protein H4R33_005642 [Dimargaris cristalligena]
MEWSSLPSGYSLILALLILVASIAFLVLRQRISTRSSGNDFLILGISDAGKTALLTKLEFGRILPTHTSMESNQFASPRSSSTDNAHTGTNAVRFVDIPGHFRLRPQYQDQLASARGLVFVLDSAQLARNVRDVAMALYDVLVHPAIGAARSPPPILVLCNKVDLFTAAPVATVKKMLETEMNRLRTTRSAALESHESEGDADASSGAAEYLGFEGQDFKFDHIPNEIRFQRLSVKNEDPQVVLDWAEEH